MPVGYRMTRANSALWASLVIYHRISNARLWNNCLIRRNDHLMVVVHGVIKWNSRHRMYIST